MFLPLEAAGQLGSGARRVGILRDCERWGCSAPSATAPPLSLKLVEAEPRLIMNIVKA
jgi:hypothetical protein